MRNASTTSSKSRLRSELRIDLPLPAPRLHGRRERKAVAQLANLDSAVHGGESVYDKIDLTKPWDDPANKEAYETTLHAYQCPSVNCRPGHTTYLAIVGAGSCFLPTQPRWLSDITDSHDSTLMVIEVESAAQVHWMSPKDIGEKEMLRSRPGCHATSYEVAYNAAFVDGSVHFISSDTKATVLRALISINGNDGAALQGAF